MPKLTLGWTLSLCTLRPLLYIYFTSIISSLIIVIIIIIIHKHGGNMQRSSVWRSLRENLHKLQDGPYHSPFPDGETEAGEEKTSYTTLRAANAEMAGWARGLTATPFPLELRRAPHHPADGWPGPGQQRGWKLSSPCPYLPKPSALPHPPSRAPRCSAGFFPFSVTRLLGPSSACQTPHSWQGLQAGRRAGGARAEQASPEAALGREQPRGAPCPSAGGSPCSMLR